MISLSSIASMVKINVYLQSIILPLCFAYIGGSFVALRVWLAVQKTPSLVAFKPPVKDMALEHKKRKRILITFIAVYVLAMVFLFSRPKVWRDSITTGLWTAIGMLVATVSIAFASLNLMGFSRAVHRRNDGVPTVQFRFTPKSKKVAAVITILSGAASIGIALGNATMQSFGLFAAIFAGFCHVPFKSQAGIKVSIREQFFRLIVIEVCLIVIAGMVAATWVYGATTAEEARKLIEADSTGLKFWCYTVLAALQLRGLFATSIRLDYANYVLVSRDTDESSPIDAVVPMVQIPAPEATSADVQLTMGVMVPSMLDALVVPFPRHYFASTFMAWLSTCFVVMQLTERGILPDLGALVYFYYMLILSIPVLLGTVVCVAAMRGELKRMWTYTELWSIEPVVADEAEAAAAAVSNIEEGEKEKVLIDFNEKAEVQV